MSGLELLAQSLNSGRVSELVENEARCEEDTRGSIRVENVKATEAVSQLSQILLAPVAEQLGNKRLLIVSDGALQYIPFSALPLPETSGEDIVPLLANNEIVNFVSNLQKNQDWQKASIISELGFKGSNYFENSGELLRKISWALVFQKKGIIFWNIGDGVYENEETACAYVGPVERSYLKVLNNFLPKMKFPLINSFRKDEEESMAIYRLSDQNYDLLYLLNLDQAKYKSHIINIKIKSESKLEFIEPSSGILLSQKEIYEDTDKISVPYFRDDLAIKISKISQIN